jgi:hypothetical protein
MIRLPTPTSRELRWGFWLVAACTLALALTVCWAIVHKVNQSDDIVRVAASNAAQVNRLSDQIDAQAVESARQRRLLKDQNRQVHAELTALLRYLRAHGIEVPQTALTPEVKPSESTRPKAGKAQPAPHPTHPASPAPTATPTPTSPSLGDSLCGLLNVTDCPLS